MGLAFDQGTAESRAEVAPWSVPHFRLAVSCSLLVGHCRAGQEAAGQGRARQGQGGQVRAGQGRLAQGSAGLVCQIVTAHLTLENAMEYVAN